MVVAFFLSHASGPIPGMIGVAMIDLGGSVSCGYVSRAPFTFGTVEASRGRRARKRSKMKTLHGTHSLATKHNFN